MPNVVFELFAAGALHAVLVPTLVAAHDTGGREETERLAGGVLGMVLAGLATVTVVAMVASPFVMRARIGSGPKAENSGQKTLPCLSVPSAATYSSGMRPARANTRSPRRTPRPSSTFANRSVSSRSSP